MDEFADLLVLEQGGSPIEDLGITVSKDRPTESESADPRTRQVQDLIEAMQLWRAFAALVEAGRLSETMELLQQLLKQLVRSNLAR